MALALRLQEEEDELAAAEVSGSVAAAAHTPDPEAEAAAALAAQLDADEQMAQMLAGAVDSPEPGARVGRYMYGADVLHRPAIGRRPLARDLRFLAELTDEDVDRSPIEPALLDPLGGYPRGHRLPHAVPDIPLPPIPHPRHHHRGRGEHRRGSRGAAPGSDAARERILRGAGTYEDMLALDESVQKKGGTKAAIEALPTMEYTPAEGRDTQCNVCIEEFEEKESIRMLPCLHIFHRKCIDRWLKTNATCPVCRASIM